jgi:methyl-accepting chemotaxis protein
MDFFESGFAKMFNKNSSVKKKFTSLKQQMITVISLLILLAVLVQSVFTYISLSSAYNDVVSKTRQSLDTKIEDKVKSIINVLQIEYDRYTSGKISEKEVRTESEAIVRDARYDSGAGNGKGYFWADEADGKCAIHSNPSYEGKMRYNEKDKEGNFYIQNLIAAGNQPNGGFTNFWFTKPGKSGTYQKRAYTAKFEPYGWYISTGNYTDDMENLIKPELQMIQGKKRTAILIMAACGLGVLLLGIYAGRKMAQRIANPLGKVTKRLNMLANGDLTSPVPQFNGQKETQMLSQAAKTTIKVLKGIVLDIQTNTEKIGQGNFQIQLDHDYPGDMLPIRQSLQQIATSMSKTINRIQTSFHQVAGGADQVSSGAQELSQATTEQASTVQQLSATIEEVSKHVKNNADNAEHANTLSSNMEKEIENSNSQMNQMMEAITAINDSSNQIGKIIKTIEEIAFQTNILALNAAIEAAHAGSAGKGFAVVADEVRVLANKSAEAAKETTVMIQNSVAAVQQGEKVADSAADSLWAVVDDAQAVAKMIEKISDSSREQAISISQINTGVSQISEVVQTNSATAEESAAVSEELSKQSQLLLELINKFQCKKTSAKE